MYQLRIPLEIQIEFGACTTLTTFMSSRWDWLPWELQLMVINLAMWRGPRRLVAATLKGNPDFVFSHYSEAGNPLYVRYAYSSVHGWSMTSRFYVRLVNT